MTTDEFLEELAEAADSFEWTDVDGIYGVAGCPMPEDNLVTFCPLTAVCWYKWHHWFGIIEYMKAGRELGLPREEVMLITKAACGLDPECTEGLRQRLLHAISNQTIRASARPSPNQGKLSD